MRGNHIVLKGWDKIELVKRIQDMEKRGYVCLFPISEDTKSSKLWNYRKSNYQAYRRDFKGTVDHTLYMVKMAREETA
ncbi:hypothetical protein ACFFIX_06515 [Metabacillus herbersteinensis]|uniref:Uncharacterized protein n=1 Tax=Metabacillus herbersteinensis TaxID=283816 RepID=A0ABV6GBP7_9BACI